MADVRDPVEYIREYGRRRISGSDPTAILLQTSQPTYELEIQILKNRIARLWEFDARRAAFDDASDELAGIARRRIIAAAIYLDLEPEPDEGPTLYGGFGVDVREPQEDRRPRQLTASLEALLKRAGFESLIISTLNPGSYGAIIFCETKEPTTREKLAEYLREMFPAIATEFGKQLRGKAAKGIVTVVVGGLCWVFAPNAEGKVTCPPAAMVEFQHKIAEATDAKEINALVGAYCVAEAPDLKDVLKSFVPKGK